MRRYRAFWRSTLFLPLFLLLFLLGFIGCSGSPCEASPGPNLDPHLLSAYGLIYFTSPASHSLYAIDMRNGSIRWTYHISESTRTFLDDDILYIDDYESGSTTLKALSVVDGMLLWQTYLPGGSDAFRLLATIDHVIYLSADNGTIEALSGRTGAMLWQHAGVPSEPLALHALNGVIYLSTQSANGGHILALRSRDGAVLWQYDGAPGPITLGDGMVFISAQQVYALRMSDGKLFWLSTQNSSLRLGNGIDSPIEANGILYLGDATSGVYDSFYALKVSDGTQVWHTSFEPTGSGGIRQNYQMQLIGQTLYIFPLYSFGSFPEGHLFALRASNGKQLWEQSLQLGTFSLLGSQHMIYLFSQSDLKAFHEENGSLAWSKSLQQIGLVATNDAIYAGTAGNTVDSCGPTRVAQLEKLSLNNSVQNWSIKLDPVPDPPLPVQKILLLLGSFLSLFGLLAYLGSRKQPANAGLLSGQEKTIPVVPSISTLRIKRIGWLFLFLPGVLLLLVAAAMAAQWIP